MSLLIEVLYLFGGWDGSKSLADFWCYNIDSAQWEQLSSDTSVEVINCPIANVPYIPLGWTKSLFMSQNVL